MSRPPRDPKVPISNADAVRHWLLDDGTVFVAALPPLVIGRDTPKVVTPSASLTMTFAVMGFGTVFNAVTNRRTVAPQRGTT